MSIFVNFKIKGIVNLTLILFCHLPIKFFRKKINSSIFRKKNSFNPIYSRKKIAFKQQLIVLKAILK